jgi:flagellar hook protein FlgE
MDISAIARQGLDQAQVQLDSAASQLAGGTASLDGPNSDSVDLSAGVVGLISAQNNFAANIKVLKTADEIQQLSIDLIA